MRIHETRSVNGLLVSTYIAVMTLGASLISVKAQASNKANADQLPSDVSKHLADAANAVKVVSIHYTEARGGKEVPGYYGGPSKYSFQLDGGRFRMRVEFRNPKDSRGNIVTESAYDGKIYTTGDPNEQDKSRPPLLVRYLPSDLTDAQLNMIYLRFGYLTAAGYYFPITVADLNGFSMIESLVSHAVNQSDATKIETTNGCLRVTVHVPDPLVLRARKAPADFFERLMAYAPKDQLQHQLEDWQKMKAMPDKRTEIFTLDPKYDYAVVEHVVFTPTGNLFSRTEATDWKRYDEGPVWLPNKCTIYAYSEDPYKYTRISTDALHEINYEVDSIEFGSSQNTNYVIAYSRPGTIISDGTLPEAKDTQGHQVMYRVAANGKPLEDAVDSVKEKPKKYWILVFVVLLLAPLFFLLRSHPKKDTGY